MPSPFPQTVPPEELSARLAKLEAEKRLIGREALNRYKELNFLYRYVEVLGAGASVNDTVSQVLEQASGLFRSDKVYLLLPNGGAFKVFARGGAEQPLAQLGAAWNRAWQVGNAELIEDLGPDLSAGDPFLSGVRSYLAVPLKNSTGVIGLLSLTRAEPAAFSSEHLKLATTLGLVSALAISVAAYAAEIEAHRARLEELVAERTRDLTLANQKLQGLASQDGLTGLANRRAFDFALGQHLDECRNSAQPLALLMLDVDHFKLYNDHYGHQGGDECLRQVARVLEGTASGGHSVVARYGGEEFAVILPGMGPERALELGNAICHALESRRLPHAASKVGPFVTVSVGVSSLVPGAADAAPALIGAADKNLYAAKQAGRNRAVVDTPEGPVRAAP